LTSKLPSTINWNQDIVNNSGDPMGDIVIPCDSWNWRLKSVPLQKTMKSTRLVVCSHCSPKLSQTNLLSPIHWVNQGMCCVNQQLRLSDTLSDLGTGSTGCSKMNFANW
jgi:hypothetical protein